VHEQITPSLRDNGLELAFTDIEIEHLGYNVSVEVMEAKVKRNYTLLLEHVKDAPLDGYAWYQLGQTLAQMNLNSEAENCIRFAIDNCKLSDSIYSSACSTLANIVGNKKNFEESLYWADKSLSKAPNQIYSLTLKGFSLLNLNRNKEALEVFEKALFIKEGKQNIPSSGFDIDLDINVIQNGINKAKTNIDNNINSGI
jgi:tetratricopeptide (TPR) repeat protein